MKLKHAYKLRQIIKESLEEKQFKEEQIELVDEIGKFFVITKPKSKEVSVDDICSEQTISSFINSGTQLNDVIGFFKQKSDARRKATELLKEFEEQLKEVEASMEEFRKAKQDIEEKKNKTKDIILKLKPKTSKSEKLENE